MTQDEIIRMAREAGFMVVAEGEPDVGDWYECFIDEIERFAALVAAHEREACAKVADNWKPQGKLPHYCDPTKQVVAGEIAQLIRSRGNE